MFKKILLLLLLTAAPALAQIGPIQGHSFLGGTQAKTQGLTSSNYLNGIIPHATISVYYTGTTTLVPGSQIFSNSTGTVLGNPFTSNNVTSVNPGGYLFFISLSVPVDVIGSGGISPNTYPVPVPLCVDCFASQAGGGGGSSCTTDCVITDPSTSNRPPDGDQTITQPPPSMFTLQDVLGNGFTFTATGASGCGIDSLIGCPEFFGKFSQDGSYGAGHYNCNFDFQFFGQDNQCFDTEDGYEINYRFEGDTFTVSGAEFDGHAGGAINYDPEDGFKFDSMPGFIVNTLDDFPFALTAGNTGVGIFPFVEYFQAQTQAPSTVMAWGDALYAVNNVSGGTITLPPLSSAPNVSIARGVYQFFFIQTTSSATTLTAAAGDTINYGSTFSLSTQGQAVELIGDSFAGNWAVVGAGTGSGSGGSVGTAGQLQMVGSTAGSFAASHATDNGSLFAITEPASIASAGASQWGFTYNATPIVPGSSTTTVIGGDSSGRLVRSNAGNSAVILSGIAAPGTAGDCAEFAANGYDLADTGSACGSGSGGFPITLGSTSIAASSTTTSVAGLSVNGVTLNAAGSSTLFLNQAGGYTAPSGTALTIQTNTTNNTLQTTLNMETSTANSVGLTVTPSNPSGGIEKFEVTGSSYTGNAATATNLASYPTLCSGGQFSQGLSSGSNNCGMPSGSGTAVDVLSDQRATGSPFHQSNEYLAVTGGTTYTLLSQTGAGVVSSLNMTLSLGSGNGCQALMSSIIKITVNGEGSPYISMPVSAFFGSGYGGCVGSGPAFSSKFFGGNSSCTFSSNLCTGNALNVGIFTRMPIPFASGITIQITMSSTGTGTFWSMVRGDTAADSWPNTEKLWVQYVCPSSATPTALCGTATGAATAYYAQEQLVNYAGSNPGRYVGTYFLNDDTPGSAVPKFATLEGNYRIFTDSFSSTWAATTSMPSGTTIMDPVGNLETSAGGTTGSTEPAFNSSTACFTGGTTTDGSVTWTATAGEPANIWRASKPYSLACMSAYDTNGNVETVVTAGTTGSTVPSWPATGSCAGTNTTDNTVTWKCSLGSTAIKALYQSTGTEDYFFSSVYFAGMTNAYGNQAENGIEFPVAASGGTVGAYRFYVREPIRFSHSIAVYRENGDSSEVPFTGGTTTSLQTSWFYTQDTN